MDGQRGAKEDGILLHSIFDWRSRMYWSEHLYLEQTVVLASLGNRYDFALPDPNSKLDRFEAFNLILGPIPIKIWRRAGMKS